MSDIPSPLAGEVGRRPGGGTVSAIIVAGGSGSRMGRPKQLLPLAGKPMVRWSLDAFASLDEVSEVVLVTSPETRGALGDLGPKVRVVEAGATRLESVRNGLKAASGGLVAVHDGARPLVDAGLIRRCLAEAESHGAAVAAAPVVDTLKEGAEGFVAATPDRGRFWAAQTPQCYRRPVLEEALAKFADLKDATDESQLVERLGKPVRLVEAGRENLKVTTPADLIAAEALLEARVGASKLRTGFGYDIHRLVEGRPFVLGGVRIEHSKGPLGHSDGDVLLHAVCDALLGAAGLGEIGLLFPPGDPDTKGIASRVIVERVMKLLAEHGADVVNVDATVLAEAPKLSPHYEALAVSVSELLGVPRERVSVKAKSHEGLGEIGRGEAIACHAVASLALR